MSRTVELAELVIGLTPEEEEEALRVEAEEAKPKIVAPGQDTETIPELAAMNRDPVAATSAAPPRPREAAAGLSAPVPSPSRAEQVRALRGGAPPTPSRRIDEIAALRAAQRRQRLDEGAQGIVQGVTRAITAGQAQVELPPPRQVDEYLQRRGLRAEQAAGQIAAQERATNQAREGRAESRAEEALRIRREQAARDAEADQLRIETARGDRAFQESLRDPNSPTSANYKNNFIDTLRILASGEGAREELPGINIDEVLARVEGMSAYEISTDPSLEALRNHAARMTQSQAGQRTRARGTGGGAVALLRPGPDGALPPLDPLRNAYVETQVAAGVDRALAEGNARVLSDRAIQQGIGSGTEDVRYSRSVDASQTRQEEAQRVPGWVRAPDAPHLTPAQAQAARTLSTQRGNMLRAIRRIRQLAGSLPEAAAARAQFVTANQAELDNLHEQVSAALREVGNYGVPTGTEIQRIEGLVPRGDGLRMLLNGPEIYRGVWRAWGPRFDSAMQNEFGYVRERSE